MAEVVVVTRLAEVVDVAVGFVHFESELAGQHLVLPLLSGDDLGRLLFDVVGGEVVG